MGYRTIRVPDWVYFDAILARSDALRCGLQSIPESVREPVDCPRCRGELAPLGENQVECASCGYKQEKVMTRGDELAGVGLGVILGLGLAAYFRQLEPAARPTPEAITGRAALRRVRRTAANREEAPLSEEEVRTEVAAARKQRARRRRSA